LTLSVLSFDLGLANRATLQAMNESFPEGPALFLDFVVPSGSEDFLLNIRVADPHGATPARMA
jgi:hypothetical protein